MITYVDTAIRFVLATLLCGLWQAPLFAFAAWLVLRVRPAANATTRHSVFAAALFASLVLPIVTAAVTSNASSATAPAAAAATNAIVSLGAGDTLAPAGITPYKPANIGATIPSRTHVPAGTPSPLFAAPSLARLRLELPHSVALVLVSLWIASAAFVLLRLALGLGHLERLKRDALPLPVDYRAELTRWAAASKGSRVVRLCTSDEIEIPIAVGLFDAMILIPSRLLEELAPHDVDSIVLHELAHLRRADDWVNAIERLAQALLFFNPGIHWLNAQLDLEREVACDDWVLQQNDALPYATCLAKVVETTVWPFRAMTAPGAFVTRRGMSIRIERLLAKQRDVRVRTSFGPAGAVVSMLAVLGIVAAFVSPSIAYSGAQSELVKTIAAARATSDTTATKKAASVAWNATPTPPQIPATPKEPSNAVVAKADRVKQQEAELHAQHLTAQTARQAAEIVVFRKAKHGWNPTASAHAAVAADAHAMVSEHVSIGTPSLSNLPKLWKLPNLSDLSNLSSLPAVEERAHDPHLVAEANAPDYIDELATAGYTNLSVDDLIQLKAVGVTASFIRSLQQQGMSHPSVSDLIEIRAVGCDPAFIGAMRKRFGAATSIGDIVGMRAVGVTTDYVDGLFGAGYKNLTASHVQGLRALGVTPAYIKDLSAAGFPNLTVDQIFQLKALGIDSAFMARAAAHGFHNLTVEQLVNLKATGVL